MGSQILPRSASGQWPASTGNANSVSYASADAGTQPLADIALRSNIPRAGHSHQKIGLKFRLHEFTNFTATHLAQHTATVAILQQRAAPHVTAFPDAWARAVGLIGSICSGTPIRACQWVRPPVWDALACQTHY
jgi:hypothetical protein